MSPLKKTLIIGSCTILFSLAIVATDIVKKVEAKRIELAQIIMAQYPKAISSPDKLKFHSIAFPISEGARRSVIVYYRIEDSGADVHYACWSPFGKEEFEFYK